MADHDGEWHSNALDSIHISQITASNGSHQTLSTFMPEYTMALFGDEESIFGYKGLKINLLYNASDMRPCVTIEFKKKMKPVGDVVPDDIPAVFKEFLPNAPATFNVKLFDEHINTAATSFTPPGTLLTTLPGPGDAKKMVIEIYSGPASSPAIHQLLTRTQILSPLLIDGGTVIPFTDFNDDRWTAYLLYSKTLEDTYTFIGFTTVYRCYPVIPGVTEKRECITDNATYNQVCESKKPLLSRARISQFVILPEFQNLGLGAAFYSSITSSLRADPAVFEITVEDPNEAFDDLRDLNDLAYLSTIPEFKGLKINADVKIAKSGRVPYSQIVNTNTMEEIRKAAKLAPGQFTKVLELCLLSTIAPAVRWDPQVHLDYITFAKATKSRDEMKAEAKEKKKYRLWLLLVKQRLYKHNRDVLIQLDRRERIEKLSETTLNVEANLFKLLRKFLLGPGQHSFERGVSDVEKSAIGSSEGGKEAGGGVKSMRIDGERASPSKKRAAEGEGEEREAKKAKN